VTSASRADQGFSLVELCISLALMLTLVAAVAALAVTNSSISRTTPENADLQQRARAATEAISSDLRMAGAGVYLGPATGPLHASFAPVVPRRMGLRDADDPTTARSDAITIMFVPQTMSQSTLRAPLASGATDVGVDTMPNCPTASSLCGFAAGDSLVVFDQEGHFDFFTVLLTHPDSLRVRSWQSAHPSYAYGAGAVVAAAEWHTYYFDRPNRQLRHFDGYLTDTPVVDDVVGITFQYFGDPRSPRMPRPPLGTANCLYDAAGDRIGGEAPPLAGAPLAPLPLGLFTDGPWCGDGDNKFDADLIRVRSVRVTLRLQVANDMLRGTSPNFAVAGRSLSAARSLPDYTVRFDVTPRNLIGSQEW